MGYTNYGTNRITRVVRQGSIFESGRDAVSLTTDILQGDLQVFDTVTKKYRTIEATDDGSNFLGIARTTTIKGHERLPYEQTDNALSHAVGDVPGPIYGVWAKLDGKIGDTFTTGCLVYPDVASTHGVTSVAGAGPLKAIGRYMGEDITIPASGASIEVHVGENFSNGNLQF